MFRRMERRWLVVVVVVSLTGFVMVLGLLVFSVSRIDLGELKLRLVEGGGQSRPV